MLSFNAMVEKKNGINIKCLRFDKEGKYFSTKSMTINHTKIQHLRTCVVLDLSSHVTHMTTRHHSPPRHVKQQRGQITNDNDNITNTPTIINILFIKL